MKKVLALAALACLALLPAVASASTYPTVFGTTVSATVPVNCSFYMPSLTAGTLTSSWFTSGGNTTDTFAYSGASCNVAFTPVWSSDNGLTADPDGNAADFDGVMKGTDTNGVSRSLNYKITVPFTGSQSWCSNACNYASGSYSISIPGQSAVGGVTYNDNIRLTITY